MRGQEMRPRRSLIILVGRELRLCEIQMVGRLYTDTDLVIRFAIVIAVIKILTVLAVALREIRAMQKEYRMLLPKTSFARLVKEVLDEIAAGKGYRVQAQILQALQEAAEAYIVALFED